MHLLKDILYGVNIIEVHGHTNSVVNHLTFDSRNTTNESVFFAIKGVTNDGHDYIDNVCQKWMYDYYCRAKSRGC